MNRYDPLWILCVLTTMPAIDIGVKYSCELYMVPVVFALFSWAGWFYHKSNVEFFKFEDTKKKDAYGETVDGDGCGHF